MRASSMGRANLDERHGQEGEHILEIQAAARGRRQEPIREDLPVLASLQAAGQCQSRVAPCLSHRERGGVAETREEASGERDDGLLSAGARERDDLRRASPLDLARLVTTFAKEPLVGAAKSERE